MRENGNAKSAPAETGKSSKQVFTFTGTDARTVQLVGDFTQWQKRPVSLHKLAGGVWQVAVELQPGSHRYRFLVDGQWRDDPACALRVANPFGSQDCVREVG